MKPRGAPHNHPPSVTPFSRVVLSHVQHGMVPKWCRLNQLVTNLCLTFPSWHVHHRRPCVGVSRARSWSRLLFFVENNRQTVTKLLAIGFQNALTKGLPWPREERSRRIWQEYDSQGWILALAFMQKSCKPSDWSKICSEVAQQLPMMTYASPHRGGLEARSLRRLAQMSQPRESL